MARGLPEVALLSIRPEYAEAILNGSKRVEFRRTRFTRDVSFVVIYATQPVGKVVGWFEVETIKADSPARLWSEFCDCGGISKSQFLAYYDGSDTGYAIRVRHAHRLPRARQLKSAAGLDRAPQSFAYLEASKAMELIRCR
ncbi:ASCH domain-containing protein [bacterium]|nr:ASCH domain-containing protein [bacterium]